MKSSYIYNIMKIWYREYRPRRCERTSYGGKTHQPSRVNRQSKGFGLLHELWVGDKVAMSTLPPPPSPSPAMDAVAVVPVRLSSIVAAAAAPPVLPFLFLSIFSLYIWKFWFLYIFFLSFFCQGISGYIMLTLEDWKKKNERTNNVIRTRHAH